MGTWWDGNERTLLAGTCAKYQRRCRIIDICRPVGPVAVSIGTAGTSVAQSAQTRIDVQGNRRVEAETIRSYFRTGGTEHLDSAKVDAALKALYATGLFQDVRITPGNGRILVTLWKTR